MTEKIHLRIFSLFLVWVILTFFTAAQAVGFDYRRYEKKRFDTLGGGAFNFILSFLLPEDRESVKKEKLSLEYLDYNWKSNDIKKC